MSKLRPEDVPADFPVRPLAPNEPAGDRVTCGTCGLSWDDSIPTSWTPAPSARCPFEYFHVYAEDEPARYLTASDVARILRVRPSAVSNWTARGSGPLPEPSAYAGTAPLWDVRVIRDVVDSLYAETIAQLETLSAERPNPRARESRTNRKG